MKKDTLENDAQKIANLVAKTDIERRGDLFTEVANRLAKKSQHFTSAFFYEAGKRYNEA